jgi:two-component system chemotaxis response regulator CheB
MNEADIRVLVVDDTVTYRQLVSSALAEVPGIEVVGTAANGQLALTKIELLKPDVLTLDLEMPVMDGLEVLRQLRQSPHECGVIVLSGSCARGAKTTMSALELGAFDFVAKPDSGGTAEQNMRQLRQQLQSKIEAFATHKLIDNIRGADKPEPNPRRSIAPSSQDASSYSAARHAVSRPPDVVALGISTGGPATLSQMLPLLPGDLPVPVLIVQHMPPVFTKSMADDLDTRCALTVCEAVDGQQVLPGHVLIAPGGRHMKVVSESAQPTIRITDAPPEHSCRPSVDYLFRSVTETYGANTIAVIMTGMGSDGTEGCRLLKKRGATIIVQDKASCVVFGMPRTLVEEGIADVVASPERIAAEIVRRVHIKAAI